MKIEKDKVAVIDYTLKNNDGKVIDSSSNNGEPLAYLHGNNNLIKGLEAELEGKEAGDNVKVVIEPENAYGHYDEKYIVKVPKASFPNDVELAVDMQFQGELDNAVRLFTVKEILEEEVVVDANHPLAGETLHFDVSVKEVREASPEELQHGHAH